MSHILLVDLSALYWANWHATSHEPVSAAFDLTMAGVRKLLGNGFDRVAVCVDSPPYKRKEISADYKANRERQPEAARELLRQVIDALRKEGLCIGGVKGAEADDVIATATRLARERGHMVTIASSDKDLFQLVTDDEPQVAILSTRTWERRTVSDVIAKCGVAPLLMRDWLALVGDNGDNVPGAKGIGPVNAAKLLNLYGSLDEMFARCDQIEPEGLRKKVFESGPAIRMSRLLVTLDDHVDLDFNSLFAEPAAVDVSPEPVELPEGTVDVAHSDSLAPEESKAIIVRSADYTLALEPTSIGAAYQLAKGLYQSKLYQKFPNAEAIMAVIIRGRELGLGALTSCDLFHVIEGKPAMHAHLITGLVMKRADLCEYFECVESTESLARYETRRRGRDRPVVETFSIEDAVRIVPLYPAKNGGWEQHTRSGKPGQWDKDPRNMLRVRASTRLARMVYPDIVAGLYAPEELEDER
jgi:5'-3' exonuclease